MRARTEFLHKGCTFAVITALARFLVANLMAAGSFLLAFGYEVWGWRCNDWLRSRCDVSVSYVPLLPALLMYADRK